MQYTLSLIEKLSVLRKAQNVMIDSNLIEWICNILMIAHKLKECTFEYLTALLMNLALRKEGRKHCVNVKEDLLRFLKSVMEIDHEQAESNINGILYCLFSIPSIRLEGKVRYEVNIENGVRVIFGEINDNKEISNSDTA